MYQIARAGDPDYLTEGQKALIAEKGYLGYLMNEDTACRQPQWSGKLAKTLGLDSKQFDEVGFQRLWDGYHPQTGEPLVKNAGDENRIEATEMVLTVPSSVSTFFYLCNEEEKKQLLDILQEANDEIFSEIEKNAEPKNEAMRGMQNKSRNELAGCGFFHYENRGIADKAMNEKMGMPLDTVLPDAHIHIHYQVMHTMQTEINGEMKTVALDPDSIYKKQKELSVKLNTLIQEKLESKMGVKTTNSENQFSFEVAGVPASVYEGMKKRGNNLKDARKVGKLAEKIAKLEDEEKFDEADKLKEERKILIEKTNFLNFQDVENGYTAEQLEHMRRASAEKKQDLSYGEIVNLMEGQLEHVEYEGKEGFSRNQFDKLNTEAQFKLTKSPAAAMQELARSNGRILVVNEDTGKEIDLLHLKLLDKDGVFPRTKFNETVISHFKNEGVRFDSLESINKFCDRAFDKYSDKAGLVRLRKENGQWSDYYTSRDIIKTEFEMVEIAKTLAKQKVQTDGAKLDEITQRMEGEGFKFTNTQRQAVEGLKRNSRVTYACGFAGVGKSKAYVKVCGEVFSFDSKVIGLATGKKVVTGLKEEGIEDSFSFAKIRNHFETKGHLPFDPSQKITLIVDEVGMTSSRDLKFIMDEIISKNPESRLIMVGDYEGQFQAVQSGCGIKNINEIALGDENRSVISDIVRQKVGSPAWHLSVLVREKKIDEAVNLLDTAGWLHRAKSPDEAKEQLIDTWKASWECGKTSLKDNLIVAGTNADVNELNAAAKEILFGLDKSNPEYLDRRKEIEVEVIANESDMDKKVKRSFCPNEIVIFKQGMKDNSGTEIDNNTTGRIKEIRKDANGEVLFKIVLDVEDKNGKPIEVEINPKGRKINNGICQTAYSSQGATVEKTFDYVTGKTTNNQFYVEMTRAKQESHVFGTFKSIDKLKVNAAKSQEKFNPIKDATCSAWWDACKQDEKNFIAQAVARRDNDINLPRPALLDAPMPPKNPWAKPFLKGFTEADSLENGMTKAELREQMAKMPAYRDRNLYKPQAIATQEQANASVQSIRQKATQPAPTQQQGWGASLREKLNKGMEQKPQGGKPLTAAEQAVLNKVNARLGLMGKPSVNWEQYCKIHEKREAKKAAGKAFGMK